MLEVRCDIDTDKSVCHSFGKKMVIYLGAKKHRLAPYRNDNFWIYYNDVVDYDGIDLLGDMLDVDLEDFDIIIATPPCNYYSKANAFWRTSKVAQHTKHLLPMILEKCIRSGKPFLVENTNSYRVPYTLPCFMFTYGTHVFYTNVLLPVDNFRPYIYQNIQNKGYGDRDNNLNVHYVIDYFLDMVL